MNIIADLHCHTLVSNHAVNTATDMIAQAKKIGLKAMAITDHSTTMPDSPHVWYFHNLMTEIPAVVDDVVVLKGIEANVLDIEGNLDLPKDLPREFDWVIASMHRPVVPAMTKEEATHAWLQIAKNPLVDMIGHCEQLAYPFDYDLVTKVFAENDKVVELNGNSAVVRKDSIGNMIALANACKKNGTKISLNSDAHSIYTLGRVSTVEGILKETDFPEELIINSSIERFYNELKAHNKPVREYLEHLL